MEGTNIKTEQPAQPISIAEPPLSNWKKFWTGLILISGICLSLWVIIAYWPDKVPTGENKTYHYELMHIRLLDTACTKKVDGKKDEKSGAGGSSNLKPPVAIEKDSAKVAAWRDSMHKDSIKKAKAETKPTAAAKTTETKPVTAKDAKAPSTISNIPEGDTIQLSTLILILVAAAGFLGNMVHIASSLGTFVGANQFRRSWILWYFVKPFTACGLALFVHFALNNGTVSTMANLYTIMTTAALAGLFTDIATQKLKEVFLVIFHPTDNRPDKLTNQTVKVMSVDLDNMHPDKIDVNQANIFLIPGQNLDPKNIVVKIFGKEIAKPVITPTLIKFTYSVDEADKAEPKFDLLITDAKGITVAKRAIAK